MHARTQDNIAILLTLLERLGARYRGRPGGDPLAASQTALEGPGHNLMMTDLAPLDILGTIEDGLTYDDLLSESIELEIGDHRIHVLSLEAIVRLKRQSSHPKDQQALPILEETLRQRDHGDI